MSKKNYLKMVHVEKKKFTAYHMLTLPINSQRVLAFVRLLSGALGAGYPKKVHTGKFMPYNL